MNKHHYKVIFSRVLNQPVVVSELAKTQGKAADENNQAVAEGQNSTALKFQNSTALTLSLKPLCFGLMLALGWVSLSESTLAAPNPAANAVPNGAAEMAIRADKSAPSNQQATILLTANGLPQVNIQTPSAAGVSRNQYAQFDVAEKGAILNNARNAAQTQMAGWVQGNPNLARGEAKVILNEVNSANPSRLKGYVEVAGRKADVVIANPNGIACDGCGIINAGRATMTTGHAQIENGELKGFEVKGGKLSVGGNGLDNRQADYTDIIAERAQLDGGLWANKGIKVTTGKNKVDKNNQRVVYVGGHANAPNSTALNPQNSTVLNAEDTENPVYSVDVSRLGGMYAEKITLVDNGTGLGVRNAGHIGASAGNVQIDSQGRIVNEGTLSATQQAHLRAKGDIQNSGKIEAQQGGIKLASQHRIEQHGAVLAHQGTISYQAKENISQRGESIAKGNIMYQAQNIHIEKDALIAAGVNTDGKTRRLEMQHAQGANITLNANETVTSRAKHLAGGQLRVDAVSVDLAQSQVSAYGIDLRSSQLPLVLNQTTLYSEGQTGLTSPQHIDTQAANLNAQNFVVNSAQLNNQQGNWIQRGRETLTLNLSAGLNNSRGHIATEGVLSLQTPSIQNSQGVLWSNHRLQLDAQGGRIDNQAGNLFGKYQLSANTISLNNRQGEISSANASITAQQINNEGGKLISSEQTHLNVTAFNNQHQGLIYSQGNITLNTQTISNQAGEIIGAKIAATAQQMDNDGGKLISDKQAHLNVTALNNQRQGLIYSQGNATLNTQTLQNQNGVISSRIHTAVETSALDNQQGLIQSERELILNAQQLNNVQGKISAQDLTLSGDTADNKEGVIEADNSILNFSVLDNQGQSDAGSLVRATKCLVLNITHINNQHTNATQFTPTQGIQAADLVMNGDVLENQGGGIYASKSANLAINQLLNNRQGEILSTGHINIINPGFTLAVDNTLGKLDSAISTALQAKSLVDEGSINTQGDLAIDLKDSFTLNRGFGVGHNLTFRTQGDFVNNTNLIVGNRALIEGATIRNEAQAEITSSDTRLQSQTLDNFGLIDGNTTLIKTGEANNIGKARIYGGRLAIEAKNLNNLEDAGGNAATIAARERLDLGVANLVNRNHSLIMSLGNLYIGGKLDQNNQTLGYANDIDNGSATIEALGSGRVQTRHLLNHDLHLKLGDKIKHERIKEVSLGSNTHRYRDGKDGYFNLNNGSRNPNSYFQLTNGHRIEGFGWKIWEFTRTTVTSTIEHQDPGKILMGGELHLSGENLHNRHSQILVGQKLLLDDNAFLQSSDKVLSSALSRLNNEDLIGEINIVDNGDFAQEYRVRRKKGRKGHNHYHHHSAFNDVHATQHFNFGLELLKIGEPIVSVGATVDEKSDFQGVSITQKTPLNTDLTGNPVNTGSITSGMVKNRDELGIKTHLPEITLPQGSLYKINPSSTSSFLVETDPRFTDRSKWLSSDYMFKQLNNDPQNQLKRLGDGFYEQRLINEQINQLTGRRFLDGYLSDYEQYKALMDNGVLYAKKLNLIPGVALSAEQMKALTSDMVWMVNREVILQDGTKTTVLTPQVYLVGRNAHVNSSGALISANEVIINTQGNVQNGGIIAGRNLTHLSANNIENQGGKLQGRDVYLFAKNRLHNLGGALSAEQNLTAKAKNIDIESTLSETTNNGHFKHKNIDRIATIQAGDKDNRANITLYATEELTVKGANMDIKGNATFQAGNKLHLGTIETENKQHFIKDGDNYYKLHQQNEVGNRLNIEGDSRFIGDAEIEMRGVSATSNGTIDMLSHGDINIQESRQKESLAEGTKWTKRGMFQSKTEIRRHNHNYNLAEASNLDANKINIQSTHGDVTLQGSNAVSEKDFTVSAKNIAIKEAENNVYSDDFHAKKKSGVLTGGGIGITFGAQKQTVESDQTKRYAQGSQAGSLNGNTNIVADKTYTQTASMVSSVNGDVNILAQKVGIQAADDRYETNTKQTFQQKGLTIAITSPILSALQAVQGAVQSIEKVGQSKNDRVNAMAAANAGMSAYRAYQAVNGAKDAVKSVADAANITKDGVDSLVGIQITYGQQKSESKTHTEGKTAATSEVNAGGKVNVTATGANKDSTIHIEGTDVSGKQGTHLAADNQVNIKAAEQTHKERSTNKSSGFNVGVAIKVGSGVAAGITVGGNYGKGYGNGDETTYVASHVGDMNSQTTIYAGGDANLIGSQVKGKRVEVNAENLNIESLQDKSTYKGKQMNVSGSVTVGYGFSAGGSYSQSKINADHASVNEQAGIYAGDDGYDVNVKNKVSSIGGAILSQASKEKNQLTTQDFEYSNIQNYAHAKSSAMGLMGGFSVNRDQTSDEDKELNKIYREGRSNETFDQANPNQANQSPVKFGLDKDDIHSSDLYAAAKMGLANLASNSSQNENRQSMTYAVISDGNFNIGSQKGKENIESIKKSTEQEANKLEKIDYSQMQKEVEQDVATIQEFAKNVGGATDEAYRTMFIAEHRMFTHKVDEKGDPIEDPEILKKINEEADAKGLDRTKYLKQQLEKGRNIYLLHELSDQERNQLQKVTYTDPKTGKTESKYVVAFNGIFNDRNSAAKFAVQNYVAGRDEKTGDINKRLYKDVYFVHHPKANNAFSELLVAGYEKMFEGSFGNLLGMDNSSLQAMNMMKQYGKDDLYLGSHSRGTLTVSNALKALNTEDNREKKLLSNTTVKMVGPAADVTRADGYLSQLQTGKERTTSDGSIRIENHDSDPVGSMPILLGGNPATTSENNLNKSWLQRTADMFSDERLSVHNCHGLGQRQCITDGYRTGGDLKMGNERTIFELNKAKEK